MTGNAEEENKHTVFVGGKPFYNYVTAVVMQFATKGVDEVVVRSRGKFIHRAVDVAEVVKSRFLKGQVDVNNIEIGSEEFKNREGKLVRVSTMDITIGKIDNGTVKSSLPAKEEPEAEVPEITEQVEEKPVEEKPVESSEVTLDEVPEATEEPGITEEPEVTEETPKEEEKPKEEFEASTDE